MSIAACPPEESPSGENGRRSSVAAVGPHIVDILGRPVTAIPAGQGSVGLEEIRITVAGTGGGAAVDLAKLGWSVTSHGAIGDDVAGTVLRATLQGYGVDVAGLVVRAGLSTAATILPIRPNGERPALHASGAMPTLRPEDLDLEVLCASDALLLGGPDVTPQLLTPAGLEVVQAVRRAGVPVFVDLLKPGRAETLGQLRPLLPLVDWFLPNDDQLGGLTGRADLLEAAEAVLNLGVGAVAVTCGADGALVVRPGEPPLTVPALPTDVVDTTGCGDAFNSGMITSLVAGCDPADAALLGCACGSLVASGLGSDAGIVDLPGVLRLIARADPAASERITERTLAPAAAGTASAATTTVPAASA